MERQNLNKLFGSSWVDALGESYFSSKEFTFIGTTIANTRERTTIYPDRKNIFRAFRKTPYDKVKVVLLGMDPYHDGSADGLCFSNSNSSKISPSLRNILTEIDTEFPEYKDEISYGKLDPQDLSRWTKQGVLMLNTALTVEKGKAGSHLELWRPFTLKVIESLNNKNEIIWLLLGKDAQYFSKFVKNPTHSIITASHPASEVYGNGGFFNSNCFRKVQNELIARNLNEIVW